MSEPTELAQQKVVEIMRSDRFCMLTSIGVGDQGRLHAHPMTPQEVTDDGQAWFFIDTSSEQADNINAEKRVNLSFADGSTWLSVAGHGTVVHDRGKTDELWNPMVEAWFPEGKDAPDLALLRVDPDSAEYWDTPGGRVASLIAFVRTRLTGQRPPGHSDSVDL